MIELNGETYLNGGEACHLLGVKVSTLYTYVSRGVLRSYKQGIKRQSLYKQAELKALIELRPSTTASTSVPPFVPTTGIAHDGDGDDRPEIPRAEDWVPNV